MYDDNHPLLFNNYEFRPWLKIRFERFAICTVFLPLFAFCFCVLCSVLWDFQRATFTHCQVVNLLPSISAAIGNFSPQREVWQFAVLLHTLPRFSIAFVYLKHNCALLNRHEQWLGTMACALNVVENTALVILSYWTSSDNYPIHKNAFTTFIVMSELYMLVSCVLQSRFKRANERRSLKWKKRLVSINITGILLAVYFFMRHNFFCEPYVYTLFALAEYVVVLTNMAFHMTAYMDFQNRDLVIYNCGIMLMERQ